MIQKPITKISSIFAGMPKHKYPYQHTLLNNIKGEKWKDIPGLEGYYRVSSFGRVKRSSFETIYRNGAIYTLKEKIIKPGIVEHPNRFKKDVSPFLTVRVTLDGERHHFMPARLVYHCFVQRFDFRDHLRVVLCRDGDNFNLRPSNLRLATRQEKQERVIQRKRFRSPLLDLTREARIRRTTALVQAVSKPVTQYTRQGKKLQTFPSMAAAERATGVFATSIGQQAAGHSKTAGGFLWRWANSDRRSTTPRARKGH